MCTYIMKAKRLVLFRRVTFLIFSIISNAATHGIENAKLFPYSSRLRTFTVVF